MRQITETMRQTVDLVHFPLLHGSNQKMHEPNMGAARKITETFPNKACNFARKKKYFSKTGEKILS